jgi:branched-chain amino acid aminotransferase
MATHVENPVIHARPSSVEALERAARLTRVFISMPAVRDITPRFLLEHGTREITQEGDERERYCGTFAVDEIGLPAFDHGLLYGDAVFEGVLITDGRLFQWREHLNRLYASAQLLKINIPYTPVELTARILEAINTSRADGIRAQYLRLVVTRGVGDLGINPARCAGSTVYCVISTIQLYPESTYQQGIRLSLAKRVRRTGANALNPQVKSCNYLNNVAALIDTMDEGTQETLMLTSNGFVAEATTDNVFIVVRQSGWEQDPGKVVLRTPAAAYCLKGITRELVLKYGRSEGFSIDESMTIVPEEFFGQDCEAFLTGTAAGLVPVVAIDGQPVGDGVPGQITQKLRRSLSQDFADAAKGLSITASRQEVLEYLDERQIRTPEKAVVTPEFIPRLFEAVDSRRWEDLKQFFSDEIVYERPGYPPLVGRTRVEKFYIEERVIVSGKHLLETVVMNGNSGACWGRFVGQHKNGAALDERFADCYTFQDGKIRTRKSYFFRPAV